MYNGFNIDLIDGIQNSWPFKYNTIQCITKAGEYSIDYSLHNRFLFIQQEVRRPKAKIIHCWRIVCSLISCLAARQVPPQAHACFIVFSMALRMSSRTRRGDDKEVTHHRRSRSLLLLAAGVAILCKISLHKLGRPHTRPTNLCPHRARSLNECNSHRQWVVSAIVVVLFEGRDLSWPPIIVVGYEACAGERT